MKIVGFDQIHISEAMEIARINYEEERRLVPILPQVDALPELSYFAENGLGVVAMEGIKVVGFLCAYEPREDAFGTTYREHSTTGE